jgi:hypothetical protein
MSARDCKDILESQQKNARLIITALLTALTGVITLVLRS